ncbi:LuxR family transcriptional regulator [Rhodococcus ruber BKS 20-38]|uniref:LuxR family transcriptional regulator n=1 Tax=Rhodococcus ruber BKS 20-38 TaxID=1278076 RepID=M2Z3T1_9NOCA|nr:LuxR C-terminal-related transcriptional regulator [Rhodococcus ruber]EME61912.1 LuxR family transcriptional regulator [Rhodococcus ruber BKS 20-38]
MSVPGAVRTGVPTWRTLATALPRPRLFDMLGRGSALTVVHAPDGFGKSTLLATWLHRGGAPEREIAWVPVAEDATPDRIWSDACTVLGDHVAPGDPAERLAEVLRSRPAPSLLVLDGFPATALDDLLPAIRHLLDRCPSVDVAVCVRGSATTSAVATAGVDCTFVSAHDLRFTPRETAEFFRAAGVELGADEYGDLCRALGGLPQLISGALNVARLHRGSPVDQEGRPSPELAAAIAGSASVLLDSLTAEERSFALCVVAARALDAELAAELTGRPDAAGLLDRLEARGLLVVDEAAETRTWVWPSALRLAVLDRARQEEPGRADELMTLLARRHHDAGRPAPAAMYAAEARKWTMAAGIVERSWGQMVAEHLEELILVLRTIPEDFLQDHPAVLAGRALFVQMLADHPILRASLPSEPDDLHTLGAGPDAANVLHLATVQSLALRVAGDFVQGAACTRRLEPLVQSMLVHQPDNITPQLPLLRVQWAITFQLVADLAESNRQFELAYRGGVAADTPYIVQNAAGSSALNWALVGDVPRARRWLAREATAEPSDGLFGELVKVGGRVAAALTHLDALDVGAAEAMIDLLGAPSDREELWGFVAYAHAQHALLTVEAYAGLTWLHHTVAGHAHRHGDGAFSRTLLTATEIDLHLALGNGNLARAVADLEPRHHPILVVPDARVDLLGGNPGRAVKKLARVSWPDCGFPRAHLEALLLEAAAQLDLGNPRAAAVCWERACTLARTLGNRRAFTTVPDRHRRELEECSGIAVPGGPVGAVFPDEVARVELSPREQQVLALLADGCPQSEIARLLFVSPNTVKTQLRSIYRKLGAHTRVEAITRARELRLLPVSSDL